MASGLAGGQLWSFAVSFAKPDSASIQKIWQRHDPVRWLSQQRHIIEGTHTYQTK